MGQVAEAWLECQKRIDDYVDEEVTMRTKQCFRKEDWEVFKQRHFVEQLIGKNIVSGENSFTDTMRHLLSSRLNISDCPNCNYRRRCTCDDCSLSHILMCGIMDSTVPDDAHSNHLPLQIDSTQDYLSEIHLPNMSSGSSGSSSPFIVHQIDRPRFILTEDDNGPTFNIENEDVSPVPEKLTDMYSMNQYDDTEISRNADGINIQLNDDIERSALTFESPQESSISSSSSEADAEEANETNSSNISRIKEGDLMLGRSVKEKEAKMNSLSSSYAIQQQVDQGTVHCECHVCKQEASDPSSSDAEMRCLPAGHQFKIPEKPAHPALHLYPHIHGQIPFHTISSLSPPRIHPSLYTVSPFTQNKQVLNTSFQDHIYPSGLGNATDWKNSKFLSLWGSEIMNEKDWSASTFLQNGLSENHSVPSTLSDLGPNMFPLIPRSEELVVFDSKKSENIVEKKCLYHCQDTFMDSNKVVMATSSATSSVSCTATTVQSSNNQFKVSSKRSSLGDVLHSINSEDNRFSVSAVAQNNPTSLVPVPSLSPVVSSAASIPCLPSPNTPSFSRITTTAPSFIDPHTVLYSTTVAPPLTTESLIGTPPSVCSDPVCEGHHCENTSMCDHQQYDGEESQDGDSCSEHSSSTSTSTNQKEGKYCDCCYCEFFGHGGPPAAPTSRNYAEMREKLRLRLTKRKEGQPRQPESISDRQSVVDHRKVEDLLQFINSAESRPVSSTRTAKRARHKQKKLKEKAHAETEGRKQEQNQLLDQQQQDDMAMQQLQDLQAVKKKKKERISNNCDEEKAHNQKYQVVRKSSPESQESLQNELLDKTDTSSGLLSKHTDNVDQESASENFCEQPVSMNGRDSKLLFKTEMTVKSNESLSLLLNIMHHHTEDKSKQQMQISKLLKKTSKATDAQPKIKNKMQSKIKVAELQSLAVPRKEDKKVSSNKAKQMNPAKKSSLEKSSFLPSESLPNKLLQDSPQPKGKSKKNKKKKNNRGNFSVDDVFLPKDVDLDNVEMDETEREVEHFKRFCLDSARQTRQRLSINWSNFSLKKTAFAVH